MEKLVLDPLLRSKLGDLGRQWEICDETGQTLGFYLPVAQHDPALYRWAEDQLPVEELERRKREPGGRTTAEVLRRLQTE